MTSLRACPSAGSGKEEFVPWHCPEAEYAAFLAGAELLGSAYRRGRLLNGYRRFVAHYPDLAAWQQRPLRERIGWRTNEVQSRRTAPAEGFDVTSGWINFNARQYLFYLGLTGRLRMDWGWLLGVGVLKPWGIAEGLGLPLVAQTDALLDRAIELGLTIRKCRQRVHWTIARLVLHRADPDLSSITLDDIEQLRGLLRDIEAIPQIRDVLDGNRLQTLGKSWGTVVFQTGVVLFHAGVIDQLPRRQVRQERLPLSTLPRVVSVMDRYVAERSLFDRPASVEQTRQALRRLSAWLAQDRPSAESLADLRRADLLDFLTWVQNQRKTSHPEEALSLGYQRMIAWQVGAFFRYASHAEWDDMPVRPPLTSSDVPRGTFSVPRYIPAHELEPLMEHIRRLECPLQRCALLVARWSGARRTEIRKLHLDCLDAYPDGTPRLRLAPGKSRKERSVPIHHEAADAIKTLIALRAQQPDRGVYDAELGRPVRRLFLNNGRLASSDYLFAFPLLRVCTDAGLLDAEGKALVHPHRFRHTLGTQLAEKGAKTLTIMKMLGHASAGMSMIYAHISDPVVLADYQAVLQPGSVLAGPQADIIRAGRLDQEALDWLKTNFYKTELELGHCLRLPQEGPCECDIYLTCPKFLTTTKYAPRLRERLCLEAQLIDDAEAHGWTREVERHQRTAERLRSLLDELGEPEAVPGAE